MSLFDQAKQYFKIRNEDSILGEFNFNNKLAVILIKDARPGFATLCLYKVADDWFDKDEMERCIDWVFNELQLTTLVCFVQKGTNADKICKMNHLQLVHETQFHRIYWLTQDCIEYIRGNYDS